MDNPATPRMSFKTFYETAYRYPINLMLHIIGVFAGLGVIAESLTVWSLWTILIFPVAHVASGLIGHGLFDRDEQLGDVRLIRTDFP